MTQWLRRRGYKVNPKRVRRLMRLMGLEAICSKPAEGQKKYPYLLKGADITYIRLLQGFVYLVAIMDWFSRYVPAWEVSTTLEKEFCLKALERVLLLSRPAIFNNDQGSQFTSAEFTGRLESAETRISLDGRGRAWGNIFVERLWQTVKY